MSAIEIFESKPSEPLLLGFIETYKWISAREAMQVRTLPNGRLDAWISLRKKFWWQQFGAADFIPLSDAGFFPLSHKSSRAKTEMDFSCISIKFFPHALTLPILSDKKIDKPLYFENIFNPTITKKLIHSIQAEQNKEEQKKLLDSFLLNELFSQGKPDL